MSSRCQTKWVSGAHLLAPSWHLSPPLAPSPPLLCEEREQFARDLLNSCRRFYGLYSFVFLFFGGDTISSSSNPIPIASPPKLRFQLRRFISVFGEKYGGQNSRRRFSCQLIKFSSIDLPVMSDQIKENNAQGFRWLSVFFFVNSRISNLMFDCWKWLDWGVCMVAAHVCIFMNLWETSKPTVFILRC